LKFASGMSLPVSTMSERGSPRPPVLAPGDMDVPSLPVFSHIRDRPASPNGGQNVDTTRAVVSDYRPLWWSGGATPPPTFAPGKGRTGQQQIPHVPVRIGIEDGEHVGEGRRSAAERLVVFPHRRRAVVVLEQDVGLPVPVHVAQAGDVPGRAGIAIDEV